MKIGKTAEDMQELDIDALTHITDNRQALARNFNSILYPGKRQSHPQENIEEPIFFHDLNLDQIIQSVTAAFDEYHLAPIFYSPPRDLRTIAYRQDVMKDLENQSVMKTIQKFSQGMRNMRTFTPKDGEHYYRYQRERRLLNAVVTYCQTLNALHQELSQFDLSSLGMRAFRSYLHDYIVSPIFLELSTQATNISNELSAIRYTLLIKDNNVIVRDLEADPDYGATVERIFEKFKRETVKDYHARNLSLLGMNHIQEQIVELVARLHPEIFKALMTFYETHQYYTDEIILKFDREVQFYVAYLNHIDSLRHIGLPFCYPRLSCVSKEIDCRNGFDLALATKCQVKKTEVVTNDFHLDGAERILIISGPNQGGKTTFARMFGQLHYLAALGCLVPGTKAKLFLFDHLFTHFEREENIQTERGMLSEDLRRMRVILDKATKNSIVIMNEVFSSTTVKDAIFLCQHILAKISTLDLLCVCVTFLDELATFNDKTVSMVSKVQPDNPVERTYKLVRNPADGLAYALAIAEKRCLTYQWLKKRLPK